MTMQFFELLRFDKANITWLNNGLQSSTNAAPFTFIAPFESTMPPLNGTQGNDTLDNATGNTVELISGMGGTDTITNSGMITTFIEGGSGNDTITNNIDGVVASIVGGDFFGLGFFGADLDGGNDVIINFGTVDGDPGFDSSTFRMPYAVCRAALMLAQTTTQ